MAENQATVLGPRASDYLRTLAGALGISSAPVLFLLASTHPTPAAIWRFLYALILLIPITLLRADGRASFRSPRWLPLAALSGLFFAADLGLWYHAIRLLGAGPATLLANTQVIWVALIGLLFLGERPSRSFWLSLPLLGAGLFLLAGGTPRSLPAHVDRGGLLLGLASGLAYALMLIHLRGAQRRAAVRPEAALLVQLGVALPVLGVVGLLDGSLPVSLTAQQHGWLLALGFGVQVGCWMLISAGIRQLPGHHGAMLLLAQPVASFGLGAAILGESPGRSRLLGAALVLLAIALPLLRESRAAARAAAENA
ncbi:MAG: DMT family transporter [Myxococcota bacterium]